MTQAVFMMDQHILSDVYSDEAIQQITSMIEVYDTVITKDNINDHLPLLQDVSIIFSGWGAPVFSAEVLDYLPQLTAIFYAAGSVKQIMSRDLLKGITVSTANTINARPVAEFTLSQILFSLKNGFRLQQSLRETKQFSNGIMLDIKGIYNQTIGIIGFSTIGKMVCEHLQNFDVDLIVYDPYLAPEMLSAYSATPVDLDTLFQTADVISLHAPLLPSTVKMIKREHFKQMKEHATFINTARGAIIDEAALIDVMGKRPDLTSLLDVTDPEPPETTSALYTLPNVLLTPHIAGSVGQEKFRLGQAMVDEFMRYQANEPLLYRLDIDTFDRQA
ncbi:glycerate dehydrogenase [Halolactibacillus miurensis]|uniref:Glycerate dehydrogenase n=1 Tax=Halolactibacillus miurensis TaxID=306541 RepID=A0A1I6P7J9_9BACI|nr:MULTISPECIES: hydroxyacid dehydrogenase [Halolactibacillus]GEM03073.1 glycerate dehydrogenase [Halolactibacillus miurensis]SFS36078.1 Phosphoglycerate dehydrogenase [Halolactibacillus miurensis]